MASGKPTLRDVAAEAGVSPMTASNALRGKAGVKESTRAKVLTAARKLDYRINLTASMLKSGRSNIIHIIVNEFDSPFYSKLTQTLSREITSRGLTPFIEQTQYSPDAAEHALSSNPFSGQLFDGEILHATGLGTNLPLAKLNGGRPLVLLDACEETPTVDAVNFPNEEGERAAVQHLIDQGCSSIAIVGHRFAPRAELTHAQNAFALRLRGACAALMDAGLPYNETVVFEGGCSNDGITAGHAIAERNMAARAENGVSNVGTESASMAGADDCNDASGVVAAGSAGSADRTPAIAFDGVCCANDFAAFGVIRGLADYGIRVPQDVKVIGFDGVTSGSYATPSLSTIQVDLNQLAKFAIDMIVERIEDGDSTPPSPAQPSAGNSSSANPRQTASNSTKHFRPRTGPNHMSINIIQGGTMPTPRTEAYLFVHFIGEERTPDRRAAVFRAQPRRRALARSAPRRQACARMARRRKGHARSAYRTRSTRWIPYCGHRSEHLPSWRMGAKRWRDHQRFDWTGDLGLPRPNALERTTFGGRGVKDSGRGHGMGAGSELGSRSRAVDRILVHQVECP